MGRRKVKSEKVKVKSEKVKKCGFTLVELIVVVAILAIVGTLAVTKVVRTADNAKIIAAEHDLKTIGEALLAEDGGYIADMRGIPKFSLSLLRIGNLLISTNLYGEVYADASQPYGRHHDDALFSHWDEEAHRGWRGPYLKASGGTFPKADDVRFAGDATFKARGFFPELSGLYLPDDFRNHYLGCSVYGFPGEPAMIDPWGNPYVLQVPTKQAFANSFTNIPDEVRFRYARIVSAGPDGVLSTPCFKANVTNDVKATTWNERTRRLARQAGRINGDDLSARGDDLVRFLLRADIDEGEAK